MTRGRVWESPEAPEAPVVGTQKARDRVLLVNEAAAILSRRLKALKDNEPLFSTDHSRTAETMLGSLRFASDGRAHLRSHGLDGIQQRHYDQRRYVREKKQAL